MCQMGQESWWVSGLTPLLMGHADWLAPSPVATHLLAHPVPQPLVRPAQTVPAGGLCTLLSALSRLAPPSHPSQLQAPLLRDAPTP